jgi:hypothetical protein
MRVASVRQREARVAEIRAEIDAHIAAMTAADWKYIETVTWSAADQRSRSLIGIETATE